MGMGIERDCQLTTEIIDDFAPNNASNLMNIKDNLCGIFFYNMSRNSFLSLALRLHKKVVMHTANFKRGRRRQLTF